MPLVVAPANLQPSRWAARLDEGHIGVHHFHTVLLNERAHQLDAPVVGRHLRSVSAILAVFSKCGAGEPSGYQTSLAPDPMICQVDLTQPIPQASQQRAQDKIRTCRPLVQALNNQPIDA